MKGTEETRVGSFFDMKVRPLLLNISSVLVGAVLAFTATGVIIFANGKDPIASFQGIASGSLGNPYFFALTLVRMTPILLTALGAIIIFSAQIWNIGQEGQLYIGALFATATALALQSAPWYIALPAAVLAGALGGIVWSGIGGVLYTFFGTDAVISSIMLNYMAIFVVHLAIQDPPLGDPTGGGGAISYAIPLAARLPVIAPGTFLHAGFLIAISMPFIVHLLLNRTALGFSIRALGFNPDAARYAGIKLRPTIIYIFVLSGFVCGLAGAVEVLGFQNRLLVGLSPGFGAMGVIAALLGGRSAIGAIFGSLFAAALLNGTQNTAITVGVSTFLVSVLQGITIIVVFALSSEKLRVFNRGK